MCLTWKNISVTFRFQNWFTLVVWMKVRRKVKYPLEKWTTISKKQLYYYFYFWSIGLVPNIFWAQKNGLTFYSVQDSQNLFSWKAFYFYYLVNFFQFKNFWTKLKFVHLDIIQLRSYCKLSNQITIPFFKNLDKNINFESERVIDSWFLVPNHVEKFDK